jgi:hypothetical protein
LAHRHGDARCRQADAERQQDPGHAGRGGKQPRERRKHDLPDAMPVMRKVSAVPHASGGARYMTPERVSVEAMPMATPKPMRTAYMMGSESGSARSKNPAALPSMLVKVSGERPMAKISRA